MNESNINVQGITVQYGSFMVYSNLSVTINKSDGLLSIIGPNGSGKSTLLSCIAGLKKVDKGIITVENKDINNYKPNELAKVLAFLKQFNSFNINITVKDLLALGRYPYSKDDLTKEDYEVIDYYMDCINIRHYRDEYISELSGGQRQRVLIAMMLIQQTPWILLDEPLNNLDIYNSKLIMKILRDIVDKENKTVIMVIHDINFAANYSDNIMILDYLSKNSYKDKTENIINKTVLEELYHTDIDIINHKGKLLCNYFS